MHLYYGLVYPISQQFCPSDLDYYILKAMVLSHYILMNPVYIPWTGCVEDAVIMYSVMAEKGDPEKRVPPLTLPKLCPSAGASPLQGFKMGIYSEVGYCSTSVFFHFLVAFERPYAQYIMDQLVSKKAQRINHSYLTYSLVYISIG